MARELSELVAPGTCSPRVGDGELRGCGGLKGHTKVTPRAMACEARWVARAGGKAGGGCAALEDHRACTLHASLPGGGSLSFHVKGRGPAGEGGVVHGRSLSRVRTCRKMVSRRGGRTAAGFGEPASAHNAISRLKPRRASPRLARRAARD